MPLPASSKNDKNHSSQSMESLLRANKTEDQLTPLRKSIYERPYHSLRRRSKSQKYPSLFNAWDNNCSATSTASLASHNDSLTGEDYMWSTFQPNYVHMMNDTNLLERCNEANLELNNIDLSVQCSDLLKSRSCSSESILQLADPERLSIWIDYMNNYVEAVSPSLTEIRKMTSFELKTRLEEHIEIRKFIAVRAKSVKETARAIEKGQLNAPNFGDLESRYLELLLKAIEVQYALEGLPEWNQADLPVDYSQTGKNGRGDLADQTDLHKRLKETNQDIYKLCDIDCKSSGSDSNSEGEPNLNDHGFKMDPSKINKKLLNQNVMTSSLCSFKYSNFSTFVDSTPDTGIGQSKSSLTSGNDQVSLSDCLVRTKDNQDYTIETDLLIHNWLNDHYPQSPNVAASDLVNTSMESKDTYVANKETDLNLSNISLKNDESNLSNQLWDSFQEIPKEPFNVSFSSSSIDDLSKIIDRGQDVSFEFNDEYIEDWDWNQMTQSGGDKTIEPADSIKCYSQEESNHDTDQYEPNSHKRHKIAEFIQNIFFRSKQDPAIEDESEQPNLKLNFSENAQHPPFGKMEPINGLNIENIDFVDTFNFDISSTDYFSTENITRMAKLCEENVDCLRHVLRGDPRISHQSIFTSKDIESGNHKLHQIVIIGQRCRCSTIARFIFSIKDFLMYWPNAIRNYVLYAYILKTICGFYLMIKYVRLRLKYHHQKN